MYRGGSTVVICVSHHHSHFLKHDTLFSFFLLFIGYPRFCSSMVRGVYIFGSWWSKTRNQNYGLIQTTHKTIVQYQSVELTFIYSVKRLVVKNKSETSPSRFSSAVIGCIQENKGIDMVRNIAVVVVVVD